MAFQTGTATGYKELSDFLRDYISGRKVDSAAINAAGSGYVVGDILTVAGGTTVHGFTADVEVTSVGGSGEVTGIVLRQSGLYSADPTTTGNAVTGGTGSGATVDLTLANGGWTIHRDVTGHAVEGVDSITNGGSGYTMGDTVTLDTSGDAGITAVSEATFNVDSVDGGGAVTGLSVIGGGVYSASDGGSGGVPTTGGTGTGLTIDPDFFGADGDERRVIAEGVGSGADQIFVGWETYQMESGAVRNWQLNGFTGFNAGLDVEDQPGVSPGLAFNQGLDNGGAFVPMQNASMEFWFFVDDRRIIVVARAGTTYVNLHMGFIDPFATSGEFPYPLMISGCATDPTRRTTDGVIDISGLTDPIADADQVVGPMVLRYPDGTWRSFQNSDEGFGSRDAQHGRVVTPAGEPGSTSATHLPSEDQYFASTPNWQDIIPNSGTPGNPSAFLGVTPDGGDGVPFLWPATLVAEQPAAQLWGEINNVFWVSKFGTTPALQPEDELVVGTDVYIVFQQGNRAEDFASFAVKRE